MRFVRGYKSVALLQILMCAGFFVNPGTDVYGTVFGVANFFGAGLITVGSALAYFKPKKLILRALVATMTALIVFNSCWFILAGVFFTTGFPLIGYDLLFVVTNLHFLGWGLDVV